MSESQQTRTRLERMQWWLGNNPLLSVVALAASLVIGVGAVVKALNDIVVATGLKQEKALELAADNAKAEFSRHLVELAWRRLFWTRNFVRRVELSRPAAELDYSWNRYLDSAAEWSADIMVDINGLERYYAGSEKPAQFDRIRVEFLALETLLVKLRTATDTPASAELIAQAKSLTDKINIDLYFFALNRPPPRESPQ